MVTAKVVSQAEADANAANNVAARVENKIRRDDAQQYVNNLAPVDVPKVVTRNDNDFASTVNAKGNPKAHIDENGNLIAANPDGTGSTTAHVRDSNPGNTPYISTTDANAATEPPKYYGSQKTTVSACDLQRDINTGVVSLDIQIVTNQKLVQDLQAKVDSAQAKFDANPSRNNADNLRRATESLNNAKRDGECLIQGCIPAPYFTPPTGPVIPIVPVPKTPTMPAPSTTSVESESALSTEAGSIARRPTAARMARRAVTPPAFPRRA